MDGGGRRNGGKEWERVGMVSGSGNGEWHWEGWVAVVEVGEEKGREKENCRQSCI